MALLLTEKCLGCGACVSVCRPRCIEMRLNKAGYYKAVNTEEGCDGCGHCKIVCPALHDNGKPTQRIIAFRHPDPEVVANSASGGAFTVLAMDTLDRGGVVYGVAARNDGTAHYQRVETPTGLQALRGSKYVEVDVGAIGLEVKKDVDTGREVLFTGLPCVVAGMRKLIRNRPNLLLVDILCHGKGSLIVWRDWFAKNFSQCRIEEFQFRAKPRGVFDWGLSWSEQGKEKREFLPRDKVIPYRDWLNDVNLSPQCVDCSFHSYKRSGDISLGDFWGIEAYLPNQSIDDLRRGTSMVLFSTPKGLQKAQLFNAGGLLELDGPFDGLPKNGGLDPLIGASLRKIQRYERLVARYGICGLERLRQLGFYRKW